LDSGGSFTEISDFLQSQNDMTGVDSIALLQNGSDLQDAIFQDFEHASQVVHVRPLDNDHKSSLAANLSAYLKEVNMYSPQCQIASTFNLPLTIPTDYRSTVESRSIVSENGVPLLLATNSPFSDHITLLEHLLRQKWQSSKNLIFCGRTE
jgi:hypothetical protein